MDLASITLYDEDNDLHMHQNESLQLNSTISASDIDVTSGSTGQVDAFLYIIVVILFYSLVLLVLMVKYFKGEQDDARYSYYYPEYVEREQDATPPTFVDCNMNKKIPFIRRETGV